MRLISFVLLITVGLVTTGCDATGTCVRAGAPGSSIDRGSCVVNAAESNCRGEFVSTSGTAGVALCRSRGLTTAVRGGGSVGDLSATEIDEQAARGAVVTMFPPH